MAGGGAQQTPEMDAESSAGFLQQIFDETVSSPINIVLLGLCALLAYKIYRTSKGDSSDNAGPSIPTIPKLKKQDMTLAQLRQYDGKGEHGRVCLAVLGKIYDMTKGARFYGPGGPYSAFAGHDATHALATFNIEDIKNEGRDISDLTNAQMESVREWEMQFQEKYEYIGRLIKEGEQPADYSDEDESKNEGANVSTEDKKDL